MPVNIEFRKDTEKALIYIPFGTSLSAAETFAAAIGDYTTASIPNVWYSEKGTTSVAEKEGTAQSLDLYAHIFLRRSSDSKLYALKIHAPYYTALFDDKQEVTTTAGEAIASLYSTLVGETFTFHAGALAGGEMI